MNNKRRSLITQIILELRVEKRNDKEIILKIEHVLEQEEDAYNSIPENMQDSMKANKMQDAIDCLDEALDYLREGEIETAIEYLFDAKS